MSNIPSNVRNYFKLELLIARSHETLRQLFKKRYPLFNGGKTWDDTTTCGRNYSANVVAKNKQINLTPVQKISVENGNSNEWDLTTLAALLLNTNHPKKLSASQIQQLDYEDQLLKQLRGIRNKLAHHATKSIDDAEFNQLWTDLTAILVAFGDVESELDKLKDDNIFESDTQTINEENVKEAKRLNSLGTQAHKDGKFSEAVALFTKATVIAGVSDHDRAVFYSNLSSIDQRYRALQDAKQARKLWSTWWKGHFRVGKVHAVLNEHEKAINSFEQALALAPTNNEIQKALDESRAIHGRQSRQEHFDPRLQPKTMDEQLNEMQQKLGTNPQAVRMGHSIAEQIDPAAADVVRGHKHEHGDIDVKQDYEQAAKYFAKAASQGNAEGMYNLARLTDLGLGVKKDHNVALRLLEQAAAQPPQHPLLKHLPNLGVAESEHALGLRYAEGISVHKSPAVAAYWYERAIKHGSAQSANNLAIMYENGEGVDKNLDKAEGLFELAAKWNDSNAMLSLANLLLCKNDCRMAKIWYDRACEAGNILAQLECKMFEKLLQQTQQAIDQCSPNTLKVINATRKVYDSLKTPNCVYKLSDPTRLYDFNELNEYANRGSITAKKMCYAFEHYFQALSVFMEMDDFTLTEEQEDTFVHELSECFQIEHIVAQWPGLEIRQIVVELVDRVLHRCSTESDDIASQLDKDARICYAVLNMDLHKQIRQFLRPCKRKYPKFAYFYELSSSVNGFLNRYEDALYDANSGLEIDPTHTELLYFKAVALRLIGTDMDVEVKAYRDFLAVAPRDHRKVPESYYAMASCYFVRHKRNDLLGIVKQTYEQGNEAEKLQLPCFLPYQSNSKTLLKHMFDMISITPSAEPAPPPDRKSHLKNPHRIEVIKQHREWESNTLQMNNPHQHLMSYSYTPRVKQSTVKSLIGLKPVSLREMNPTKDHVYNGYVLSVTIIEEAWTWTPSIHLVVEDDHFDCERMFIYDFPDGQGEHLTSKVFTIGSKMSIINPYLRLGANDMKPLIRIDDFSSIVMQSESERVLKMCRCCGEANAPHVCIKCKQARYCSKECQIVDWQLYKHKLICQEGEGKGEGETSIPSS
jgi:TPR repeat protein